MQEERKNVHGNNVHRKGPFFESAINALFYSAERGRKRLPKITRKMKCGRQQYEYKTKKIRHHTGQQRSVTVSAEKHAPGNSRKREKKTNYLLVP